MDPLIEIQFRAGTGVGLAEGLLRALEAEGEDADAQALAAWIAEGHVRVDDVVVRDPAQLLVVGQAVELSAWPAPAEPLREVREGPVAGIEHLDDRVLVATYNPPVRTRHDDRPVLDHLETLLIRSGVIDRVPFLAPEHLPRASGLVAAGLMPRGARELDPSSRPCGPRVNVKALVRDEGDADLEGLDVARRLPGALLVRTPPVRSSGTFLADLMERGLRVLEVQGPQPEGSKRLLLHVAGLALTHPHTGHTQMWMCMQPAYFREALETIEKRAAASSS